MSTKTKFYKLLTGLMLLSTVSFAQLNYPNKLLEFTINHLQGGGNVINSHFGPTTATHVVSFDRDTIDNNNFVLQTQGTNPVNPILTATVRFENQQYTGFSYGAGTLNGFGTTNEINSGLCFGAAPSLPIGVPPGLPDGQQGAPLNSYDLLGAFNGGGGPRNGMFQSQCQKAPIANYPGASGTGIDAEYLLPGCCANDGNGGVQMFTCAQRMFDLNNAGGTANRYYYGDLVIQFSGFVDTALVHIAGLGGSYRFTIAGGNINNPLDWRSVFFSTELELVTPGNAGTTVTKMSGNQFMTVSGRNILNNAIIPNGESIDVGAVALPNWNNFGAATGTVRVTFGVNAAGASYKAKLLRFKVYLRGSDANSATFKWSSLGSQVAGGVRNPVTGDIWTVAASVKSLGVSPACPPVAPCLAVTGLQLNAALNGNDVALSWKTETELNSDHFEIERSTDNINFSRIGSKQAAGNSVSTINYAYTDPNMAAPAYYYRLRMVDIDGQYVYSNIAFVRKSGGIKGVRVFPNPVTSQVNIEFSNAKGNYEITVYNQLGQIVMSRNAIIASTVQYVNLSKGTLASGSYLISAKNTETNEKYVQNVIFQ
jgi:hypothetical protein